jgi:5S rRNA maturation endonuclease (ribonuclease M5)
MSKLEDLERLLAELADDERLKLVEGKRDKLALEYFGVKNIRLVHTGALREVAERIKEDEVILKCKNRFDYSA